MKYGDRLKKARKLRQLSQDQLAEISGVKQGSISKIERNAQGPSAHDVNLAKALNISADWLTNEDGPMERPATHIASYANLVSEPASLQNIHATTPITKVPLISWVSAGMWCEAIDNYSKGDAEQWLPCPIKCSHNTYALKVIGDSMTSSIAGAKTYPEGSIIYVDPDMPVSNGKRVIAKLIDKNEVTFKTYKQDAGQKWLMPINPQYDKIPIDNNVILCGVIIAKYEPE